VEFKPEIGSQTGVGILSKTQRVIGLICLAASAMFAAEAIYEQTLLTQAHGLQMLGFTLAHEHISFLLLGSAGTLGLYVWSVISLTVFGYLRIKRGRKASTKEWLQLGTSGFVLLMFWIPYEWWQFSTIQLAGPGLRAANQLTTAASRDHRYLVDALLRGGLKVDSPDTDGHTALAKACSSARKEMADYLISRGAKLDSAAECRRYSDYAAKMKPEVPPPHDGLPKAPGETVVVTAAPHG
jgi:hypothetical protein